jgi:hypothetical protein
MARTLTNSSRVKLVALVDEVLRLIATVEARKRRRGPEGQGSIQAAVERFVGDLLVALAKARHNAYGNCVAG